MTFDPSSAHPPAAATPRDAATLMLVRGADRGAAEVLMGQRGGGARFMPNKVVFPGGALDPADLALAGALAELGGAPALPEACVARLGRETSAERREARFAAALGLAALRETFEETGLRLAMPDSAAASAALKGSEDPSWRGFASGGAAPALGDLRFVFRAITPPASPIRFDARFFLADAGGVLGDLDDFSGASQELSQLAWRPLAEAQTLDLPFITSVALAEVAEMVESGAFAEPRLGAWSDRPAPFFRHDVEVSRLEAL